MRELVSQYFFFMAKKNTRDMKNYYQTVLWEVYQWCGNAKAKNVQITNV